MFDKRTRVSFLVKHNDESTSEEIVALIDDQLEDNFSGDRWVGMADSGVENLEDVRLDKSEEMMAILKDVVLAGDRNDGSTSDMLYNINEVQDRIIKFLGLPTICPDCKEELGRGLCYECEEYFW